MAVFSKEIISGIYPFNKLKKSHLGRLHRICEFKEYHINDIVYKEGDPPDAFYMLITGRLVALARQGDKDEQIELIKKGTAFGTVSLFTDEPHSVTVRSIENSVVLRIEKDRFKGFLDKNHILAVEFSRIFSKRVKKHIGVPKKIFQSVKLAICSFAKGRGKTTYMVNLANALAEDRSKKVIVVECSFSDDFAIRAHCRAGGRVLNLNEFSEENIDGYVENGQVSWLCVKIGQDTDLFFSLINYLSENYHFVLYELSRLDEQSMARLVSASDLVHLFMSSGKEELARIESLMSILAGSSLPKVRFIFCEFLKAGKPAGFTHKIYATIPPLDSGDYKMVIRRISREVGEKTVGLVLGSGGAFCFSQIGVLKVLEENNIPIDIVCGSSMGALIGALWALGYPAAEIERIAAYFGKKFSLFSFPAMALPFRGFLKSKRLEKILKDIFDDKTFYDIKHSFRVVAFDFIRKESRVIREGYIYSAVAASCAMPGIFEPIVSKDGIFLDGGVLNPLPVKSILDYARKIIAVNVSLTKDEIYRSYTEQKRWKFNIFDFIFGSVGTMQREFINDSLKIADVVIHPNLDGMGWVDFSKVEELADRGEAACREKMGEIIKLVSS